MKTAIMYQEYNIGESISLYVIDNDHSHLDGIVINASEEYEKEVELNEVLENVQKATREEFTEAIKAGAKLIECGGFLLRKEKRK